MMDVCRPCFRTWTILEIWLAASSGDSCAQILTTSHPSSRRRRSVSASRARLASIFARQNSAFFLDQVACRGQPCQKQPSTNTATRGPRNTMSATRRGFESSGTCRRYRRPSAYKALQSLISMSVPRWRTRAIRRLASSDEGATRGVTLFLCVRRRWRNGEMPEDAATDDFSQHHRHGIADHAP